MSRDGSRKSEEHIELTLQEHNQSFVIFKFFVTLNS